MIATIYDFEHLRQAENQQLERELEYRRIARERGLDTGSAAVRLVRDIVRRIQHHPAQAGPSVLSPSR